MRDIVSERLSQELKNIRIEDIGRMLAEHSADFTEPERGFSVYMRAALREKGVRQQEVFLKADISEGYGYKLISGEKRTRRRDTLLRLCFAAGFSAEETDTALRLGRMPSLYPRFARDALLLAALNCGVCDPAEVNELLEKNGFAPLIPSHLAD